MDLLLMVMDLVVSAPELVFTQLVQSMSPDLLRVLVREVLTQDILPMDMDLLLMVMDLVVSAPELVFTQLVQFMSPDLLRVLVREVLMLSQDILVLAMVMTMVLVVSVQVL